MEPEPPNDMKENIDSLSAEKRMIGYLQKIATGPKMSKDLTEEEAEDGLNLVLNGEVSAVRSALFLIAARMKRETLEENLGFWRALDRATVRHETGLDRLLQVADAFDGFQRVPYFGFYVLPVLAEIGLQAYGHSSLPQPPKFGITFEDLLVNHYGVPGDLSLEKRMGLIEKYGFGFLSTRQTHPKLDALNDLRREIVKRPMLATFEKLLMPLKARKTFLATNYFHPGYEQAMLHALKHSQFDHVLIGNGMEGTTLYGVHKTAKMVVYDQGTGVKEMTFSHESLYDKPTAQQIAAAFRTLKETALTRETLAALGEQALKDGTGPAAPLIAHHAGSLLHLLDIISDGQKAFDAAFTVLKKGNSNKLLENFLQESKQ